MATKDQLEFFKGLYEEEERTSGQLEERAKVYLSIITAFFLAFFLKADDLFKSGAQLGLRWQALLVNGLLLGSSLICILIALRIRRFEAVNDGLAVIDDFGDAWPTDEDFFEDRIADYAVASSRNRFVNNRAAYALSWAAWLLIVSMLCLVVSLLTSLIRFPNRSPDDHPVQRQEALDARGAAR